MDSLPLIIQNQQNKLDGYQIHTTKIILEKLHLIIILVIWKKVFDNQIR